MEHIPIELLHHICLYLDYVDIINWSRSSKLYIRLCTDDLFWQKKVNQDFDVDVKYTHTWRLEYENLYRLHTTAAKFIESIMLILLFNPRKGGPKDTGFDDPPVNTLAEFIDCSVRSLITYMKSNESKVKLCYELESKVDATISYGRHAAPAIAPPSALLRAVKAFKYEKCDLFNIMKDIFPLIYSMRKYSDYVDEFYDWIELTYPKSTMI